MMSLRPGEVEQQGSFYVFKGYYPVYQICYSVLAESWIMRESLVGAYDQHVTVTVRTLLNVNEADPFKG